jgi:CDP-diacylglycerol--glycerol-3-phosphate 3-phosphatidyltransferase
MNGSIVSPEMRQRVRDLATPIAAALGRLGFTPNELTLIGFLGTCLAAVAGAFHAWLAAGLLLLAFGIFDLFDGALARATGRTSSFGAFLDSTLDRTGENLVLAGIAIGCSVTAFTAGVITAVLAMSFASVVTYTRAKAESLGFHGEVGVAPRSERVAILGAGLVLAGMPGGLLGFGQAWLGLALLIIAALSAITVAQRTLHVQAQAGAQAHQVDTLANQSSPRN